MTVEKEQIEIAETDRLLRRVLFLDPNHIKPDGKPSSFAFSIKKNEDGLSVDIESLTTYAKSIQDVSRFRLYAIGINQVKSIGLTWEHDPLEDGSNDAHALIKGINKSAARNLADQAERIAFPD